MQYLAGQRRMTRQDFAWRCPHTLPLTFIHQTPVTKFERHPGLLMSASPRLRWLCQNVTDLLGVGSPNEVEALLRDPDAAAIVSAFFRGQLDAVVFFYQPKEVPYDMMFLHIYLFGHKCAALVAWHSMPPCLFWFCLFRIHCDVCVYTAPSQSPHSSSDPCYDELKIFRILWRFY
jgi:hypothetical protein